MRSCAYACFLCHYFAPTITIIFNNIQYLLYSLHASILRVLHYYYYDYCLKSKLDSVPRVFDLWCLEPLTIIKFSTYSLYRHGNAAPLSSSYHNILQSLPVCQGPRLFHPPWYYYNYNHNYGCRVRRFAQVSSTVHLH